MPPKAASSTTPARATSSPEIVLPTKRPLDSATSPGAMPSVDGADDDHDMVSDAKYKASTSSTFPQTRVKRIIKEDKDIMNCQNDAVFAVTVATELFLQKFAEMAYNQARKRNAKSIAYGDVASAVQMTERFRFLEDVVPPTVPLRKALKQRETLQKSEEQQHDEEE